DDDEDVALRGMGECEEDGGHIGPAVNTRTVENEEPAVTTRTWQNEEARQYELPTPYSLPNDRVPNDRDLTMIHMAIAEDSMIFAEEA
ncbi:hypothetical protein PSY47_23520, partial [Shigella flexneri]|nr:hypothetical protein [Shigella flexneri]